MKPHITKEALRELFNYIDGEFIYKKTMGRGSKAQKGDKAGWISSWDRYKQITIHKRKYKLHRLIYVYHYDIIPEPMQIDHIDGDRLNNKIENLRMVTYQENCWNKKATKGYFYCKRTDKYRVQLAVNNKKIEIGRFSTSEEAREAYLEAKKIHHNIPNRQ